MGQREGRSGVLHAQISALDTDHGFQHRALFFQGKAPPSPVRIDLCDGRNVRGKRVFIIRDIVIGFRQGIRDIAVTDRAVGSDQDFSADTGAQQRQTTEDTGGKGGVCHEPRASAANPLELLPLPCGPEQANRSRNKAAGEEKDAHDCEVFPQTGGFICQHGQQSPAYQADPVSFPFPGKDKAAPGKGGGDGNQHPKADPIDGK